MIKNLTVLLALSVLLTACGGSDNNNSSKSSSSVAVSSSSVKSSSVAVSSSSVVMSSSSVVMSSSSVSVSSSSEAVSSSSVAVSSSSSYSSSSVPSGVVCEPNDGVIPLCDLTNWKVDGGNGGSFVQGELGPIFTNGAPTGGQSYNAPGMFYVLEDPVVNATVVGKTLTFTFLADQALKDSGSNIQLVIQEEGNGYGGDYGCWFNNADILVGEEFDVSCTHAAGAPANGAAKIRLGFQLVNSADTYLGTLEIHNAIWE
jgi:hypothetical protein